MFPTSTHKQTTAWRHSNYKIRSRASKWMRIWWQCRGEALFPEPVDRVGSIMARMGYKSQDSGCQINLYIERHCNQSMFLHQIIRVGQIPFV